MAVLTELGATALRALLEYPSCKASDPSGRVTQKLADQLAAPVDHIRRVYPELEAVGYVVRECNVTRTHAYQLTTSGYEALQALGGMSVEQAPDLPTGTISELSRSRRGKPLAFLPGDQAAAPPTPPADNPPGPAPDPGPPPEEPALAEPPPWKFEHPNWLIKAVADYLYAAGGELSSQRPDEDLSLRIARGLDQNVVKVRNALREMFIQQLIERVREDGRFSYIKLLVDVPTISSEEAAAAEPASSAVETPSEPEAADTPEPDEPVELPAAASAEDSPAVADAPEGRPVEPIDVPVAAEPSEPTPVADLAPAPEPEPDVPAVAQFSHRVPRVQELVRRLVDEVAATGWLLTPDGNIIGQVAAILVCSRNEAEKVLKICEDQGLVELRRPRRGRSHPPNGLKLLWASVSAETDLPQPPPAELPVLPGMSKLDGLSDRQAYVQIHDLLVGHGPLFEAPMEVLMGLTGLTENNLWRIILRLADPLVGALRYRGVDRRDLTALDLGHRFKQEDTLARRPPSPPAPPTAPPSVDRPAAPSEPPAATAPPEPPVAPEPEPEPATEPEEPSAAVFAEEPSAPADEPEDLSSEPAEPVRSIRRDADPDRGRPQAPLPAELLTAPEPPVASVSEPEPSVTPEPPAATKSAPIPAAAPRIATVSPLSVVRPAPVDDTPTDLVDVEKMKLRTARQLVLALERCEELEAEIVRLKAELAARDKSSDEEVVRQATG